MGEVGCLSQEPYSQLSVTAANDESFRNACYLLQLTLFKSFIDELFMQKYLQSYHGR